MKNMERTFNFGKIDYRGRGRRTNKAEVTVTLYNTDSDRPVLSVSGGIWNGRGTDYTQCGQCLDTISKYVSDPLFRKIYRLWKNYHLNDMHPGNEKQEKFLKEKGLLHSASYDAKCEALKKADLYIDDNGVEYAHIWYYHPIPAEDLADIKELLK